MPSRRTVLVAAVTGAATALAGCSGDSSGGSDTIDCQTSAAEHGDGNALDRGIVAEADSDRVVVAIPLSADTVREQGITAVLLYDAAGRLRHRVPVSAEDSDVMAQRSGITEGQLRYEQTVGHRPFHGRIRAVAVTADGRERDSVTVEFNCFIDVDN